MFPAFPSAPRGKLALVLISLAVVFISQAPSTLADYEHYCSMDAFENQRHGACGDNLMTTLETACTHFFRSYSSKYVVKRSYPTGIDREVNDLMVNKKDALSFLSKRQSSQQNIVCECCVNSCSILELLQYCEPPRARRVRSQYPKSNV